MSSYATVNLRRICRERLGLSAEQADRYAASAPSPDAQPAPYCAVGLRLMGKSDDHPALELHMDDVNSFIARVRLAMTHPEWTTDDVSRFFAMHARRAYAPAQPWSHIYPVEFFHTIMGCKDSVPVLAEVLGAPEPGCYFGWLTRGNVLKSVFASELEVRACSRDGFNAEIEGGWGNIVPVRITPREA